MKFDAELDATGLKCPLPILRTKKALFALSSGQTLRVLSTDKNSPVDFAVFATQTGNVLLASSEDAGVFEFHFRRK